MFINHKLIEFAFQFKNYFLEISNKKNIYKNKIITNKSLKKLAWKKIAINTEIRIEVKNYKKRKIDLKTMKNCLMYNRVNPEKTIHNLKSLYLYKIEEKRWKSMINNLKTWKTTKLIG